MKQHSTTLGVWLAAALLLAQWFSVVAIWLTPEVPQGQGFPHDRIAGMDQGGAAARHEALLLPGWAFGALLIAGVVGLLWWSTDRSEVSTVQRGWLGAAMLLGGLAYEGCFAAVFLAHRRAMFTDEVPFLGPFPAALAWMLFGVWLVPIIFVAIYLFGFHRWVFPPESAQRFGDLVRRSTADRAP